MRRALTVIIIALTALVLGYYLAAFRPYQAAVQRAISNNPIEYSESTELLYKLVKSERNGKAMLTWVSKSLMVDHFPRQRAIMHHINHWAWQQFLDISYTDREIFELWASVYWTYGENGSILRGVKRASEVIYDQDIEGLDEEAIAGLVVRIRAPSIYVKRPDKLKADTRKLLEQFYNR